MTDNIPTVRLVQMHNDHEIRLSAGWKFVVDGPEFAGDSEQKRAYDSLAEAYAAIDYRVSTSAKAARTTLDAPVLLGDGRPARVKGINAATGWLTFHEMNALAGMAFENQDFRNSVYADTPAIRAMIAERMALTKRLKTINRALALVAVGTRAVHGRIPDGRYDAVLASVKTSIDIANKRATTLVVPE